MIALLTAALDKLQTDISACRDTDIYLTEDVRLIRRSGSYPAIGLKDGGIGYDYQTGDEQEDSLQLTVACYVSLHKQGANLVGNDHDTGVLQLAADVVTSLRDELFLGVYETALPLSQGESEILAEDENMALLMVPVLMKYTRIS